MSKTVRNATKFMFMHNICFLCHFSKTVTEAVFKGSTSKCGGGGHKGEWTDPERNRGCGEEGTLGLEKNLATFVSSWQHCGIAAVLPRGLIGLRPLQPAAVLVRGRSGPRPLRSAAVLIVHRTSALFIGTCEVYPLFDYDAS